MQQTLLAGNSKIALNNRFVLANGFTLIELLVVILIISILAGLSILSIGDSKADLIKAESQKLHALIRELEVDAILQGKEFGISFSKEGGANRYSFFQYDHDEQTWNLYVSGIFQSRLVPDWVDIDLSIEAFWDIDVNKEKNTPDIYFFSSGEKTPFIIKLSNRQDDGFQFLIQSNGLRETELVYPAQ